MGISVSTAANNDGSNNQEERANQVLDAQNAAGGQRTRLLNDQFYLMFGGPPINYNAFFADTAPMFFFSRPRTEAPPPPPPEVKSTVTIKNDLNLLKRSLRLVPLGVQTSSSTASTLPKQYILEFEFDTRAPCDVYVHFCANERKDKKNNCIVMIADKQQPFLKRAPIPIQKFAEPTLGLKYRSPIEYPIDFSTCKLSDLEYSEQTDPFKYPVVIELRSPGATPTETKYQFTYASIYQSNDGMFLIKPLKQKIQVNGYVFELADIYGIEQHGGSESQAAPATSSESATTTITPQPNIEPTQSDDDRLCVICISEQTDTAVLPCRHMCLCLDCAKMLRMQTNKCPICRAVIESIIQIPGAKREGDQGAQTEQEQAKGKEPLQLKEDTQNAYSLE